MRVWSKVDRVGTLYNSPLYTMRCLRARHIEIVIHSRKTPSSSLRARAVEPDCHGESGCVVSELHGKKYRILEIYPFAAWNSVGNPSAHAVEAYRDSVVSGVRFVQTSKGMHAVSRLRFVCHRATPLYCLYLPTRQVHSLGLALHTGHCTAHPVLIIIYYTVNTP